MEKYYIYRVVLDEKSFVCLVKKLRELSDNYYECEVIKVFIDKTIFRAVSMCCDSHFPLDCSVENLYEIETKNVTDYIYVTEDFCGFISLPTYIPELKKMSVKNIYTIYNLSTPDFIEKLSSKICGEFFIESSKIFLTPVCISRW